MGSVSQGLLRLPEILVHEDDRALPGEFRRGLVIAGLRGLVVEGMLRALIDVPGVLLAGGLCNRGRNVQLIPELPSDRP